MPTKRRKIAPARIRYLSDDQRMMLECGWTFWFVGSPEPPPFRDQGEMRQAWRVHGARLLAEWRQPWTRPRAFWLFDAGVEVGHVAA
jgi:hypothetical protein